MDKGGNVDTLYLHIPQIVWCTSIKFSIILNMTKMN